MQIVDIAYLPVRILLLHQTKQPRPAQTSRRRSWNIENWD